MGARRSAVPEQDEVLIVEDDPDTLASVAEVLVEAGYRVTATSSAAEAWIRLTGGYRPGVMLVDLRMPQMTGQELLEACRADPALAGIPAIVMSADVPEDLLAQVRWILRKPFTLDGILAMLALALSGPRELMTAAGDVSRG